MNKPEYFDYNKVAEELNVPDKILVDIVNETKAEFPKDKMMFELHVLRALKSMFWKKSVVQEKPTTRKTRPIVLAH